MNTELRIKTKNDFEKDFFKLMSHSVFGRMIQNVKKHGDIKLVATDRRRSHLVLEPNYCTTKCFSKNLMVIEMNKTKVKINKPVYLGLFILDIRNIVMFDY